MQCSKGIIMPLLWKTYVDNRSGAFMSYALLDYAVKKSLSDNKLEGTEDAWTDEEKQSARDLIGASKQVTLTQAEYDALETVDENTYYYITEE
jgi:hypothetical protein